MPTIKCKMCGGSLNVEQFVKTAKCDFCETEQTIPSLDNERRVALFNRANVQRLKNEYDNAIVTYQTLLADNPKDAEAHFGILLCKYGIEYVDDPKTGKRIPTCHRTVYDSIFDDEDYLMAIENADVVSKKLYIEQAINIDKIQKEIINISQNENPYDVFICYKETNENGDRTKDSVIAQEIYDELIALGYNVFFSRITLENMLGSEYEPIIFGALNTSKVMLVIGTKEEYINSPWVKNEWKRYISLMESERGKYIVPCYLDMDPYDLPDSLKQFQAQDLSKLGYMQDLTRGIEKLLGGNKNQFNSSRIDNMLKRSFILIEDGDFKKADQLVEEVLNEDVECAKAYLAKILIKNKINKEEDIITIKSPLKYDKNYEKILRYGDDELKSRVKEYNDIIIANVGDEGAAKSNKSFVDDIQDNIDNFMDKYKVEEKIKNNEKSIVIAVILLVVCFPIGIIYSIIKIADIFNSKN